jgi:hypothetical protein
MDEAIALLKGGVEKEYRSRGKSVVDSNLAAIDHVISDSSHARKTRNSIASRRLLDSRFFGHEETGVVTFCQSWLAQPHSRLAGVCTKTIADSPLEIP